MLWIWFLVQYLISTFSFLMERYSLMIGSRCFSVLILKKRESILVFIFRICIASKGGISPARYFIPWIWISSILSFSSRLITVIILAWFWDKIWRCLRLPFLFLSSLFLDNYELAYLEFQTLDSEHIPWLEFPPLLVNAGDWLQSLLPDCHLLRRQ